MARLVGNDANVVNVTFAAKCLEAFALGLRSDFSANAPTVLAALLEKCKEKKRNVVEALVKAADAVFKTAPLDKTADTMCGALKSKNPQVKEECCGVLARGIQSGMTISKPLIKDLATILVGELAASQPSLRDASAAALAAMISSVGDRAVAPFLSKADATRAAKVCDLRSECVIHTPRDSLTQ